MTATFQSLPLELKRACLEQAILMLGARQAVRLRLICKLFNREVIAGISSTRALEKCVNSLCGLEGCIKLTIGYIFSRALADGHNKANLSGRLHRILQTLGYDSVGNWPSYKQALKILASTIVRCNMPQDAIKLLNENNFTHLLENTLLRDVAGAAAVLGKNYYSDSILSFCSADSRALQYYGSDIGAFSKSMLVLATMGDWQFLVMRILNHKLEGESARDALFEAIRRHHKPLVRLLLGAVQAREELEIVFCEAAAAAGNWNILKLVCDRHQISAGHPKVLFRLAQSGNYQLVTWSLTVGAGKHINTSAWLGGNDGYTALTAAASGGHAKIVNLLLARGAKTLHDDDDAKVMMEAAASGNIETVQRLLYRGCKKIRRISLSPLVKAARCGHHDVVRLLLSDRTSQRFEHAQAKALALRYAAGYGFWSVARSLLENGAPPDGNKSGYSWDIPMKQALDGGHGHIVELLRSFGAKELQMEADA
ncbi:hypothetical protein E2P81_ATG09110 [Venturia nashicola]|uniref:Uncharacterized protein n=1 Tax=Venturia nashicola TaxID=86259 RepID=A0A4Z1NK60_9PEZI|nr:hypothetical protein E6O75_ATG09311 [Venturia nashicola]TLD20040.1 hypothetical protein E2P81_ATG09110 [Venturia nashicola]